MTKNNSNVPNGNSEKDRSPWLSDQFAKFSGDGKAGRRKFIKKLSAYGIIGLTGGWLIKKATAKTIKSPERIKFDKETPSANRCDCEDTCDQYCNDCTNRCSTRCINCPKCACDSGIPDLEFASQAVNQQGAVVATSIATVHNSIAAGLFNTQLEQQGASIAQGKGMSFGTLGTWDEMP